jgi:hypothetical protein
LRAQLTSWRRDHELQFHTRAIIVVERRVKKPSERDGSAAAREMVARRTSKKEWALVATLPVDTIIPSSDQPVAFLFDGAGV